MIADHMSEGSAEPIHLLTLVEPNSKRIRSEENTGVIEVEVEEKQQEGPEYGRTHKAPIGEHILGVQQAEGIESHRPQDQHQQTIEQGNSDNPYDLGILGYEESDGFHQYCSLLEILVQVADEEDVE